MAEELQLQYKLAEEAVSLTDGTRGICLQYKKVAEEAASLTDGTRGICHPIIVAVKGPPCTERRLVALWLAASFRCLLLKEDDFHDSFSTSQVFYQIVPQMVESQLQLRLSVIIDSELSDYSLFSQLKNVANANKTPLFIVECRVQNELELCRIQEVEKEDIATEHDMTDVPKFTVDITTSDDIKKCVSELLQSFVFHFNPPNQRPKCNWHLVYFKDHKRENCKQCHQSITGPSYRCKHCDLIFHKSCTELPQKFSIDMDMNNYIMTLAYADDNNEDVRCSCCKQLINGYYYDDIGVKFGELDLNCIFLPFICKTEFHDHPLVLFFAREDYRCEACGIVTDKRPGYTCLECQGDKYIVIDPHCACSPETETYATHDHPFKLTLSPVKDDSNQQFYCDFCTEERDPNYWMYRCAENCDYTAHLRCLVPEEKVLPLSEPDKEKIMSNAMRILFDESSSSNL